MCFAAVAAQSSVSLSRYRADMDKGIYNTDAKGVNLNRVKSHDRLM